MAKKNKPKQPKTPLSPEQKKQAARDKALSGLYGAEGVNAGNALMGQFLPEGALGRVSTNLAGGNESLQRQQAWLKASERSPEETMAIQRMQAGLDGYTSAEYQASREQMMKGQQSNFRTAQGQLAKAQARGKVYGAAGAAQQANLAASAQASKDDLEQQLMVKNIDEQRSRLKEFGDFGAAAKSREFTRQGDATKSYNETEAGLRQETLDREKLNLGQSNAEIAARIGLFTGAGGTALQKAQQKAAQSIQKQGIALMR